MLTADAAGMTKMIKALFKEWDADGNGSISREEMKAVMYKLGPFTQDDINMLMAEADLDEDGEIDYDEFVNFIMAPAGMVKLTADGKAERFNLLDAFRPLFEVYDLDKTGGISVSEFRQCNTIVTGALEELPNDDFNIGALADRPALLESSATAIFKRADRDGNERLDLREFAELQRDLMEDSGLRHESLTEFVHELAKTMNEVLDLTHGKRCGNNQRNPSKEAALKRTLCLCTDKLFTERDSVKSWSGFRKGSRIGYNNVWQPAPPGMNITGLLNVHMACVPMPTKNVKEVAVKVDMVVPDLEVLDSDVEEAEARRRWLAKVTRNSVFLTGDKTHAISKGHYYRYDPLRETWQQLPIRTATAEYEEAVKNLAPELRLLALLYREANFADRLSWGAVRQALDDAVEMELLTDTQRDEYDVHIGKVFHKTMVDELGSDDEEPFCPICFTDYWGTFENHMQSEEHQEKVADLAFDLELKVLEVMRDLAERDVIPAPSNSDHEQKLLGRDRKSVV